MTKSLNNSFIPSSRNNVQIVISNFVNFLFLFSFLIMRVTVIFMAPFVLDSVSKTLIKVVNIIIIIIFISVVNVKIIINISNTISYLM